MRRSNAQEIGFVLEPSSLQSVDDAFGVIRDAIAALLNVETLLRSPKIGPKALQAVVPGLKDQRDPVTLAVEFLVAHLYVHEEARPAVDELFGFIEGRRKEFAEAVDRAARGLYTARERLAFQNEVERLLSELRTQQQLTELLLTATQAQATYIDLRQAIEQAFLSSKRGASLRTPAVSAALALPDARFPLYASPAILMPLITLAVGIVHRATGAKPSLIAESSSNGSMTLVISDAPAEGDWLAVHPPELTPPVIACAKAAARMGGGEISISEDEREVVLRWPRG